MGRVMSVIAVPMMLAPILGPTLGGVIIQNISWRWIFYVNVPIGVIAVVAALRTLPWINLPERKRVSANLVNMTIGSVARSIESHWHAHLRLFLQDIERYSSYTKSVAMGTGKSLSCFAVPLEIQNPSCTRRSREFVNASLPDDTWRDTWKGP